MTTRPMRFLPIEQNVELDVCNQVPEPWDRIAIACGWTETRKARAKWPAASVVAPLRSLQGFDELVRNLLYNPQLEVLVWDGHDLTPGKRVLPALEALWRGERLDLLGEDLHEPFQELRQRVHLVVWNPRAPRTLEELQSATVLPQGDCTLARQKLPPQKPVSQAPAPQGDPGDRIAGATVSEVYPRALRHVLACGARADSQHGPTRELLNLVSVIRDPLASAAEAAADPDTVEYYARLLSHELPEGAEYTYGSRLRGVPQYRDSDPRDPNMRWASVECPSCPPEQARFEVVLTEAQVETQDEDPISVSADGAGLQCPRGHALVGRDVRATWEITYGRYRADPHIDQIWNTETLLRNDPKTRSAFLTPWRDGTDTGHSGGRPCMVGLWFYLQGEWKGRARHVLSGQEGDIEQWSGSHVRVRLDDGTLSRAPLFDWELIGDVEPPALHATMAFRSHDLTKGYPRNLAAICLWMRDLADTLMVKVGTLTCTSYSAHIYERDIPLVQKVLEGYKSPAIRWDPRTIWTVKRIEDPQPDPMCSLCQGSGLVGGSVRATCLKCRPHGLTESLRATALTPDGERVIQVFEAPSTPALCALIADSGLVQEPGAWLWLGAEIARTEAGAR